MRRQGSAIHSPVVWNDLNGCNNFVKVEEFYVLIGT